MDDFNVCVRNDVDFALLPRCSCTKCLGRAIYGEPWM